MTSEEQIHTIKSLASKGRSVNSIKDELGLPKSTVYYHFKKEVGQKQKENQLKIPEDEEVRGEICGIFAGDGSFYRDKDYHYRIRIHLNYQDDYWRLLANFLESHLGKRPQINTVPENSQANLRYNSKSLYEFFKEKLDWHESDKSGTVKISSETDPSGAFKKGFLRGLIDTDGHYGKAQERLRFNTISVELSKDTSRFLSELKIPNWNSHEPDKRDNCRTMYRTHITGSNVKKFLDRINPRNPKKQ